MTAAADGRGGTVTLDASRSRLIGRNRAPTQPAGRADAGDAGAYAVPIHALQR
jgi:hypothetical protein